jgi:subtilisin family serine protease
VVSRVLARRVVATALVAVASLPASAWAAQPGSQTWNFQQAHIPGAQAPGRNGAGVTVAVVDTWIDWKHPAFGGRFVDVVDCVNSASGGCRDHVQAPDQCVHGTHVAGTVGSSTYGVAPAVSLLAVQVLSYDPSNGECSGSTADVAAGITWAAHHGAKVINLSVGELVPGLFQASDVTAAVHEAASAGAVVVVAAGNSGLPLTDDYGADALLVAATGPSGGLASYSDYGGSVSLAAPGGDDGLGGLAACSTSTCVYSTEPGDRYGLLEGTSMAAPHVSGAAALLLAQAPGRGRADVMRTLETTARPLGGAGHGLLDAAAALAAIHPATSPVTASGSSAPALAAPSSGSSGAAAAGAGGTSRSAGTARPPASGASPAASRAVTAAPSASASPGARRASGAPVAAPASTPTSSSGKSWMLPVVVVALAGGLGTAYFVRRSRPPDG